MELAYAGKVDVINVVTAPEIEMLIIFNEDKYKEFKKSGKKPSSSCDGYKKISWDVKSTKGRIYAVGFATIGIIAIWWSVYINVRII